NSCEIAFEDVELSDEDVIGAVGEGWRQMLGTLNNERIMAAAVCCGILKGVFEDALRYAGEREAFGKPIGQFQAIQHGIADMRTDLDIAQLLTYRAAWLQEIGAPCGVESTMAKMVASEKA